MKQQRGSRTRESDIATQSDTQEEVKNSAGAAWDNPSKFFLPRFLRRLKKEQWKEFLIPSQILINVLK